MSACEWAEQAASYVGRDLTPEEAGNLERHICDCRECRELLADLTVDAVLLRSPAPIPDSAYDDVHNAVLRRLRPQRRWWPAAAAAAGVLAVAGSVWYQRELNQPIPQLDASIRAPQAPPLVTSPEPPPRQTRVVPRYGRPRPNELAMALRAMLPPVNAAPAAADTPVLITAQTEDPDVLIILIPENTGGDTHE